MQTRLGQIPTTSQDRDYTKLRLGLGFSQGKPIGIEGHAGVKKKKEEGK